MLAWLQSHLALVLVILAVAVVLLVVVAVLVLRWRESKKKKGADAAATPSAERPPTLVSAWRRFVGSLDRSVRGRPVALVIGPTGSGKTSLVARGALGQQLTVSAVDHPSASFYAAGGWLVIELGWEAFRDVRAAAVAQREALFAECAWQLSVLAVVLDASAPLSSDALAALGAQVGSTSSSIAARRAAPVSVRVCWTHLDEESPGFNTLAEALSATDPAIARESARRFDVRVPSATRREDAVRAFDSVAGLLAFGLRSPRFSDVLALCGEGAERWAVSLVPFFDGAVRRGGEREPQLDGVMLAGLPAAGPTTELGDVFRTDAALESALRRARLFAWLVRGGLALALGLALFALTQWQWSSAQQRVQVANVAVDNLERATRAVPQNSQAIDAAAIAAGTSIRRAPVVVGRRSERDDAARYARAIVSSYLAPRARSEDPSVRALALGLAYSSPRDSVRRAVADSLTAWSVRSSIPEQILRDYIALSPGPTRETLEVPAPIDPSASWARFERALDELVQSDSVDPARFEAVQRSANEALSAGATGGADASARELIDAMRAENFPVDRWFRTPSASESATSAGRERLLRAVIDGSLAAPTPQQPTLEGALRATQPLESSLAQSSAGASAADGGGAVTASDAATVATASGEGGATAGFDPAPQIAAWQQASARMRIATTLDRWAATRRANPNPSETFFVEGACGAPFGASVVPGRGATTAIRCEYEPQQVQTSVTDPRAQLRTLVDRLDLAPSVSGPVTSVAEGDGRAFDSSRLAVIEDYASHYAFSCESAELLENDVAVITGPGSYLRAYLATIGRALSGIDPAAQGELASIASVATPNAAGATPSLDPFFAILRPMLPMLSSIRPVAVPADARLPQRVAPIGALALQMLEGGETSTWLKASAWLDAHGVPARLRRPFMAPVACAYQLGIAEVERVLAQYFQREMAPSARRQWSRFPFDPVAEREADPAEVESTFGPNGQFWTSYDAMFSPVMETPTQGRWRVKRGPNGADVVLPNGSLCAITRAARTRSLLFTSDGARRPLALDVHSAPLPLATTGYTPSLVTLRAGEHSVSAFNQAALWQSLSAPWGDGGNAGLAVRLSPVAGGAEQIVTLDRGPSDWSFQQLLTRATSPTEPRNRRVVTWRVRAPNGVAIDLTFQFRSDPWAAFAPGDGCEEVSQ